jgi:hypothetical protein
MAFSWAKGFITALLFIVISSPTVYKLTNSVFAPLGLKTSDAAGKASNFGVLVHAIVFVLLLHFSVPLVK